MLAISKNHLEALLVESSAIFCMVTYLPSIGPFTQANLLVKLMGVAEPSESHTAFLNIKEKVSLICH
jgi:hypothetical protein